LEKAGRTLPAWLALGVALVESARTVREAAALKTNDGTGDILKNSRKRVRKRRGARTGGVAVDT